MEMTCGYCNKKFTLEAIHIKKQMVKENPIIRGFWSAILGKPQEENTMKYFIYCPCCNQKIGRID